MILSALVGAPGPFQSFLLERSHFRIFLFPSEHQGKGRCRDLRRGRAVLPSLCTHTHGWNLLDPSATLFPSLQATLAVGFKGLIRISG